MVSERDIIRVGTRGSKLALRQTEIFIKAFHDRFPELNIETAVVRTRGDQGDTSMSGAFTDLLEKSLANNKIDIAVHSLKDLPLRVGPGCRIGAILRRGPVCDCLISNVHINLIDSEWIIGTSSPRRRDALLALNPALEVRPIHGNIDSRISRFTDLGMDGIVLAKAGLVRLEWEARISKEFKVEEMVPAPGQGAIAIEIRENETQLLQSLRAVNDPETEAAASIERNLLGKLGGDCGLPLGAYAYLRDDQVWLWTFLGLTRDGKANNYFERFTFNDVESNLDVVAKNLIRNWSG